MNPTLTIDESVIKKMQEEINYLREELTELKSILRAIRKLAS